MRAVPRIFGVFILLFILSFSVIAQENRTISYGETVSAYFDGESSHDWSFAGSASEIIDIEVRRIAGRFVPDVSLIAPDGSVHRDLSYFSLPQDGSYTLRVAETANQNMSDLILNEYSLSMNYLGRHRVSIGEDLDPLPVIEPLASDIVTGTTSLEPTLGINIIGNFQLSQPDPADHRVFLLAGTHQITIHNGNPLSRAISTVAFLNSGLALQTVDGAIFYTDQDILSLESNSGITSITLANGLNFTTDFYRIRSIQVIDRTVEVIFSDGQRLIAIGQSFEFSRRGGINGEGPNVEPVNIIRVDDSRFETDLAAWYTLAVLQDDVRVYYEELRYLGTTSTYTLFADDRIQISDGETTFSVDPLGMGDIVMRGDNLTIKLLDGREIIQTRRPVYDVTIANRSVSLRLEDGSARLFLPDGTLIESPGAIPVDNTALPNQSAFRPRNFNNLGLHPYDYHPSPDFNFALLPVNRVNGNFFYQVNDFSLSNDSCRGTVLQCPQNMALNLEWTRYYNSMGKSWRHSYQYELDIRYAPLGEVWLILPDGSQHVFERSDMVYRSESLLSWTIQQRADASWEAFNTEGYSYEFDLGGRLQRITRGIYSLLFSPVPQEYLGSYTGGFFVTDDYGRRIEVYQDSTGLIREVRDVLGRSIRYNYEGANLVSVDYSQNNDVITYGYTEGLLTSISDGQLQISYDVQGRVSSIQRNNTDWRSYSYLLGSTSETEDFGDGPRHHVFSYDQSFRLTRYDTPRRDWFYRWNYSTSTGRLSEIAQPDHAILRLQYDEFGYLTTFTDPLFGSGTGSYNFHYISPDERLRLLSAVDIPGDNNYIVMEYDSENRLIRNNDSSYTYDEMGRVQSIQSPERNAVYSYDQFGYISTINEGDGARVTQQTHDMLGRLLSEMDGRGTLTSYLWSGSHNRLDSKIVGDWRYDYAYDERGNLVSSSFNGHEVTYFYDALNQVIERSENTGDTINTHHYRYDDAGNLVSHTFPNGSIETFTYDDLNMLTSHIDSTGLETSYSVSLNIEGNRTTYRVSYPSGESIDYTYDALGRLRQALWHDRTGQESFNYTLTYNPLGYLTAIDENHVPGGRNLSISYDSRFNPSSITINNIARTTYVYDDANRLVSETDPEGRTTGYAYDGMGNLIGLTQPDASILHYRYDANGNLASFTETGGEQWLYNYDVHNRLIEVIDPAGNSSSYEYDDLGNLSALVNANGGRISFEYDEASRLSEYTDLAGNLISYSYNERGKITSIAQTGGLSSDFFYDSADNLTALTQSGGRETLFGRDNEGRVVSVTDSLGHSSFFAYNVIGTLGRLTNPLGNETTFRWSASGRIVGYSSSSGAAFAYGGDRIGRLTSLNDVGTNQTIAQNTFVEYDDSGYITEIRFGTTGTINSNQASVHRYTYTPNGQIATYLPPEATNPWRFTYDLNGRMSSSTNPLNVTTNYAYDEMGNITEIRRAVDTDFVTVESFAYDSVGNLTRYIAPDGLITTYEYNDANRLITRTETDTEGNSRSYAYEYDAYGRLSSSTDPNGSTSSYHYDLYGNLIVEEHGGLSTRYEYDEVNNLRRIESPAGQSQLMTYNALGLRVRYTDAETNAWSYGYDDAGNLTQVTDPLGNTTAYRYDPSNRLMSIIFPNDALIELAYDGRGTLSQINLPNSQRINTEFDRAGNLSSVQYASNQTVSYEYDELNRLTLQTNADRQQISYTYDVYNRLASRTSPEGTETRSYDNAGRLTQISDGGTVRFAYDGFGNLTSFRSSSLAASYNYDDAGNLLLRDFGSLGSISYSYDALYRPDLITIGAETIAIGYNENGWRTSIQRSSGVETRYVYDDNGRVRNILHLNAEGERLDGFAYEYDAVGNILRVTRIDNWAVLYSYDESQNLISERWLSDDNQVRYSVSYGYDANGNRSEQTTRIGQNNPERTLFVYNNQNQLIEEIRNAEFTIEDRLAIPVIGAIVLFPLGWYLRRRHRILPIVLAIIPFGLPLFQFSETPSTSYSYDANGNLSSIVDDAGANLSFSYDSQQRLIAVEGTNTLGEGIHSQISYDLLGNIAQVTEGDQRYTFIYDAFGLVAIQNGSSRTLYVSIGDEVLLTKDTGAAIWPLNDAFGVPRVYLSADGSFMTNRSINASSFGELINPYEAELSLTSPQPIFPSSIYLPQAQLHLRGSRAYDPRLGRELQRPPLPAYAFSDFDPLAGAFFGLNPSVPELEPESFLPSALSPAAPSYNSVHSAQAAETRRILALADMAYSQLNQPNILRQFAGTATSTVPSATQFADRELFASSLREVPMYQPLIEELPYLLNFTDNLP